MRDLLCLRDLAARLPKRPSGRPHTAAMLRRWILQGVGGVHLEAVRLGAAWYSTEEDVRRFGVDCVERERAAEPVITTPSFRRHQDRDQIRRNEIAIAKLRKDGFAV